MTTLRRALRSKAPSLESEHSLWDAGARYVVGIDEVGRGSWAGPLTVGVVAIPRQGRLYKLRDSKMLTEPERERAYERIIDWVDEWSVGHASPGECDALGMAAAQRLATRRALDGLHGNPDHALVDGNWDFVEGPTTHLLIRGDARCLSIAAASIVAKVTRDRMLRELAPEFPHYGFESNKGYPSPNHRRALHAYGPSVVHRRSWSWMEGLAYPGVHRVERMSAQSSLF
jgi:ribonuclease HII